ncbi:MAG: ATP-binding protein [Nocardioides sp.]
MKIPRKARSRKGLSAGTDSAKPAGSRRARRSLGRHSSNPSRPNKKNKKWRSFGGERSARMDLAANSIVGHLVVTDNSLWAWYELTPQKWSFRTPDDRELIWDQIRNRLAGLSGHAVKIRVSSKPFPTYEFARRLAEDTPSPLPPSDGGDFDTFLERQQRRLLSASLDETVTMLGVRLGVAPKAAVLKSLYAHSHAQSALPEAAAEVLAELRRVNELVGGAGLDGVPLSPAQMQWLMHRSIAVGMPVQVGPRLDASELIRSFEDDPRDGGGAGSAAYGPGAVWESDDLYAFTDPVDWIYSPMGPTVRVEAKIRGQLITRHVAVLSIGRMPDRRFPEDGRSPWMLATARLGYPVEWCASGILSTMAGAIPKADYDRQRAVGIRKHYDEHEELPPPAVARAIDQSVQTYDEVTEGEPRDAVRFEGPIRAAVYGETEAECLKRVRNLIDVYGDVHRIEVVHGGGQRAMLRELIPGEPWSTVGYQRRMSVGYLAAAMPHVSSSLGTPTGPYVGYTAGTARRAVRFDGHLGMEVLNIPGVYPVVADPGGGKSVLSGAIAALGVERGEPTILLDPSGPLGRLCEMERFKPFSRLMNLTESEPGTLSPWQLVPEPLKGHYERDRDFDRAVRSARAERCQLALDTFRMLHPEAMLRDPRVDEVLRDAVRTLGGAVTVNPRDIFPVLEGLGEVGIRIAKTLRDAAEFPLGELLFPPDAHTALELAGQAEDKSLVVITMPGLAIPDPNTPREYWGVEEMYAQPLLHLAAFFTSRFIYGRPMRQRKNIVMDENHFMGNWGSGRALMMRLSRDSRKWDTAVYPASQHPDDILGVGKVESLIGGAFVGRIEDLDTARRAMKLVRAPESYATVAQKLSPRPAPGGNLDVARTGEFIFLDPYGRVDKMRFDVSWYPELKEALDTTPGYRRVAQQNAGPSPFVAAASGLFTTTDQGAA